MGNSSARAGLKLTDSDAIQSDAMFYAAQDLSRIHPAGERWEQPEGTAFTVVQEKQNQAKVAECLKELDGFSPEDQRGAMRFVKFHHPQSQDAGDFIITSIKSNDEVTVYVLARTLGEAFIRRAVLFHNHRNETAEEIYSPLWKQWKEYQHIQKSLTPVIVVCKMVDAEWVSALIADLLRRRFEWTMLETMPLSFIQALKQRFQKEPPSLSEKIETTTAIK